jgi:hypothetical protein
MLGYSGHMLKRLLLLLLLVLPITQLSAECYKWVDGQGEVHYSDRPHEGAETVKLPEPKAEEPAPVTPTDEPMGGGTASTDGTYKTFAIAEPENNQTIRSNDGTVKISFFIQPPMLEGHKIFLYVNGQKLAGEMAYTRVSMSGLECGINTIHAVVVDAEGKTRATTKSVLFHLRKEAIKPLP